MTKTLLLAAVALATLATVPARADILLSPNSTLIGDWCEVKKDTGRFRRGICPSGWDNNWRRLTITRQGYEFWEWSCKFVERKNLTNGAEFVSECGFGDDDPSFDRASFVFVGNQLQFRLLSN
jgi:hypothetical protein